LSPEPVSRVTAAEVELSGVVIPGFEPVRDEFLRNFVERGDVGAAFAAVCDGQCLVDIWGGVADPESGRPWSRDTLQIIFSGTKGVVATARLVRPCASPLPQRL